MSRLIRADGFDRGIECAIQESRAGIAMVTKLAEPDSSTEIIDAEACMATKARKRVVGLKSGGGDREPPGVRLN